MKRTIVTKLIVFYSVVAVFFVFLINVIAPHYLRDEIIKDKKNELNQYSQYIHTTHFDTAADTHSIYDKKTITVRIAETDKILNTRTWIFNADGDLLIDSGNENYIEASFNILEDNPTYFESYCYINNTVKPLLTENMLSIVLPISQQLQMKGYIVIHSPMEPIMQSVSNYITFANLFLFLVTVVFALAILLTYHFTIRPTRKITQYISSINKGEHALAPNIGKNSEFNRLQLELMYMEEKIENLDDYQKNFIANVSHDFRSPLTSIKGYAEAMLDGTIPEELHSKYLNVIVVEVERLTKLTSNLLSLNQFEQGGYQLDLAAFDINLVLKQTAASFEGTCKQKHIKLKLVFSEKETYVTADKSKIQQVLYNLLDNAIKFSHKDSEIHLKTLEKREKVLVSVKDFGIGIPKDGLNKIWERFYKTDLSRGKDKKGTGLGLSITKEIISAHNETINVTSTEGAGTEFTFTLTLTTPNNI